MLPRLLDKGFLQAMVCMLFLTCNSCAQNKTFVYREVPEKYLKDNSYKSERQMLDSDVFDITQTLPPGYVINGTVDYTAFLQSALNNHAKVAMPSFPVMVNESGLTLNSGQTFIFKEGSKLILKPSARGMYEVLRIHHVENITVYSPVIKGDKTTHTGTDGQWGMGIAVRASKNITIVNAKIYRCWGDGIYIGGLKKEPSQNISIINPLLDDNRRNGISITSANGVNIIGGIVANSNGQMPQSGIDIEPNRLTDVIDNINISDVVTYNHPKYGIVISLQQLRGRTAGQTNISIKNTTDDASGNGIAIIGKPSADVLNGEIEINNPAYLNQADGGIKFPLRTYGIKLKIGNRAQGINGTDFNKLKKAAQAQPEIRID